MSGDGVVAHNRRTYFAENVDPTRTRLNVEYCYTPIEEAYHQLFDAALAEFNAKQKRKDRCIENYYEKIRDGKQEKPFYEVIFQVGNKDDMGTVGENAELAKTILDKFYHSFLERNSHLHVYSAHLHMDEATPHLHIDFIPFTTGSKRGLSTRVSLKQALADQGITGEGRSLTERDLWVQKEKEALAEIMLEHGIEWEQKGEHKEHLSVLEFKREKRKEELAELEQSIERVQQQQVSIQAVEQIEAKPLPLTSKVAVDREDYQNLVTAAQKYVVQEKQESKLKKLLKEAKKTISDLKAKIQSLTAELSAGQSRSWHNTNPSVVSSAQQIWNRKISASAPKSAAMKAPSSATIYGIYSIRAAIKPAIGTIPAKSRVELQKLHFVQRESFKRC